jgi:sugar phosphate isomerase/epimerase
MTTRRTFLATAATLPFASTLRAAVAPKFKLGLVTYNVAKDWDLATILRIGKATGVAAVELRTTHKHGVEPALAADERARIKQQFADAGIVFWGCGTACEYHAADMGAVKKQIEETKRFLQLSKDLGGTGIKVRPNGVAKGHTVEQACTQIGAALKECGDAAANLGLEIQVEVHGPITQEPKHMKAIMDACGHKAVGVTWNSNKTDLDKSGSIATNFNLLKDHIRNVHINDLDNDKKGTYPYRELFKLLGGIGYDRYTMCEVGKDYTPEAGEDYLKKYTALWKELCGG